MESRWWRLRKNIRFLFLFLFYNKTKPVVHVVQLRTKQAPAILANQESVLHAQHCSWVCNISFLLIFFPFFIRFTFMSYRVTNNFNQVIVIYKYLVG